ncbi:MAG: alginate export family protein [Planctomycetota bacterium]
MLLTGCVSTDGEGLTKLAPGQWIEAKGRMVDGRPLVDEIDELERSDSDKGEKLEVTAEVASASPTELQVLGMTFAADPETEFEDEDKDLVEPYVPKPGEWVKLKLRNKEGEGFRLRTVRRDDPREQFKVEGEIFHVDPELGTIDVGGIRMPVQGGSSITALGERSADDPLSLFQADEQKAVPFTIAVNDNLRLGGGVSFGLERQEEYDLDPLNERDRTRTDPQLKFDALWLFADRASYAMVEVETGRSDNLRDGGPDTYNESLQVTRALASVALADGLQVLVGRQDFDEEREWLFDEVLDGVRVVQMAGDWQFDASAAMGREALAEDNSTEDVSMFTGMARYRLSPDWQLGAYVFKRLDTTPFDHEPLLLGIRSIDDPRYGLGHWAELAMARGHSNWMINNGGPIDDEVGPGREDIDGWAFDVGALYTFDTDLRPALTVGYAYGSGRRDSSSHQGFRQSGFQDNNFKLGGVTSVRYYGELLRPELANLAVFSAGVSVRPTSRSSISFLYHTYTQDYAAESHPITDLRIGGGSRPNGRDYDLGHEFDLVFGLREFQQTTIELVLARFEPGGAFDDQAAATKLDLSVRFSF